MLLELDHASRHYGSGETIVRALDDVSLAIDAGEYVAIIGQSGSGKSTLMNILGCLDRPTGGAYRVRGVDISTLGPDELAKLRRDTFGFVFQRYNLLSNATALENVEVPAVYAGANHAERIQRAKELLGKLGLAERTHHKPSQLSGGQQQRVSIARALMNDAEVILADEPTGALDSGSSAELLELFDELHKAGRTIILITHEASVAEHADRIIEIRDGKILSDSGRRAADADKPLFHKAHKEPSVSAQAFEAIKTALRSLHANIFRTVLTLLGVIIGVAAVVAMLAIGEGSRRDIVSNIEKMGSNMLFVRPGAPGTRMRGDAVATLTIADAKAIAGNVDNVKAAVPTRDGQATLRIGSIDYRTSVSGVSADWPKAQDWPMADGAFFTEEDETRRASVVVLGDTVYHNLFPDGGDVVGQYVFIGGAPFEVAGVLTAKGATAFGRDMDDIALIPITTGMMRLFGQNYLSSITIAVNDTSKIDDTEAAVQAFVLARHGTEDFQIRNTASLLESIEETQQSFALLLASVAAISLLVGGIGVMNIMLVNVTERTREIGVRMATGARRSDIMVQFNTEALVVCGLGGIIGVLVGLSASLLMSQWGVSIGITPEPAIVAFSSALATGLIFGYMPARKASRLDPVVALASE